MSFLIENLIKDYVFYRNIMIWNSIEVLHKQKTIKFISFMKIKNPLKKFLILLPPDRTNGRLT